MSKTSEESKSLVEQIVKDMFGKIQNSPEFNEQILQELKQLAEDGGLKKAQRITQVLKSGTEKRS